MRPLGNAPTVSILGWYGLGNAGDEAILHVLVSAVQRMVPHAQVLVVAEDPRFIEERYHLEAVPCLPAKRHIPSWAARLLRTRLLIVGGGGIINDHGVSRYFKTVLALQLLRRRVVFYAIGADPIHGTYRRWLCRTVMNRAAFILARDPRSAAVLQGVGVRRSKLAIGADPALLTRPAPPEAVDALWRQEGLEAWDARQPIIAVSLRPLQMYPELAPLMPRIVAETAAALGATVRERGAGVLLLPLHFREDAPILRALKDRLPSSGVRMVNRWLDPSQVVGVLGRCQLLVGMRLHAHVFASLHGVPSVALAYLPKVRSFMQALGREGACLDVRDVSRQRLLALVEETLDQGSQARSGVLSQRDVLVAQAQADMALLARALGVEHRAPWPVGAPPEGVPDPSSYHEG